MGVEKCPRIHEINITCDNFFGLDEKGDIIYSYQNVGVLYVYDEDIDGFVRPSDEILEETGLCNVCDYCLPNGLDSSGDVDSYYCALGLDLFHCEIETDNFIKASVKRGDLYLERKQNE